MQDKPDVESITGLLQQLQLTKTTSRNPRSTVGTATEIYDHFRLLFARIGVPYSPETALNSKASRLQLWLIKFYNHQRSMHLHHGANCCGIKGE